MASTTQETGQQSPTEPDSEEGPPESPEEQAPRVDSLDFSKLRDEAAKIKVGKGYRGKLTMPILSALEGLLNTPIPESYLEFSPKTEGKPYESTGLKAMQVQVDILNAVLGSGHWRLLTFYKSEHIAHCWLIIGNDVHGTAKLSDDGESVEPNGAKILTSRDGWGGVKRSNHEGDGKKGSQTNAGKRAIAQVGPGSNVYRLDYDEDLIDGVAPAGESAHAQGSRSDSRAQPRESSAGRKAQSKQTPEKELAELLATDDDLKDLRLEAEKGMGLLDFSVGKRLGWLKQEGNDREGLQKLVERASNALEAQTAEAEPERAKA